MLKYRLGVGLLLIVIVFVLAFGIGELRGDDQRSVVEVSTTGASVQCVTRRATFVAANITTCSVGSAD